MNVALLKKIKKHILEVPARYTFGWVENSRTAPCGTRACIAGWAMVLSGELTHEELKRPFSWSSRDAARVLGISDDQRIRLFIYWPSKFQIDHHNANTAAKRIDHFIKTKGVE